MLGSFWFTFKKKFFRHGDVGLNTVEEWFYHGNIMLINVKLKRFYFTTPII